MKKTDKVLLKRAFATNHRALKLIYKHYPQMVVSQLLSVVWNALTPYVGIFLSALVIDELAGGRDVKRLQMLVIITLASAAVIALGTALLNKWKETQNAGWWLKIEHIVSEKMLDTDYVNRFLREFCVSDFRQNQEYHVINVHDGGLFPLSTPVPEGWDGMRAGTA